MQVYFIWGLQILATCLNSVNNPEIIILVKNIK